MANDRPPDSSAGVVIADDDDGVRDALGELIDDHPALFLIASVGSGLEAAALCSEHHPPLAVIDVMMPSGGSVAIEAILAASPTTRVMAYTVRSDRRTSERLMASGASAVLAKGGGSDITSELVKLLDQGGLHPI